MHGAELFLIDFLNLDPRCLTRPIEHFINSEICFAVYFKSINFKMVS